MSNNLHSVAAEAAEAASDVAFHSAVKSMEKAVAYFDKNKFGKSLADTMPESNADTVSDSDGEAEPAEPSVVETPQTERYRNPDIGISIPVDALIKLINADPALVSRIDFAKNPELARHIAICKALFTEDIEQTPSVAYVGLLKGANWRWVEPENRTSHLAYVALSIARSSDVEKMWEIICTDNPDLLTLDIYTMALSKSPNFFEYHAGSLKDNMDSYDRYLEIVSSMMISRPYWMLENQNLPRRLSDDLKEIFEKMDDTAGKFMVEFIKANT